MTGHKRAVAAVAAEHDLPYVCVPAGTRNHFALDLGIDRNDVVGALDAFIDGHERRIDLGRVNGRVFVNNVAMGVYGAVVQSPAYRDHKVRTVIDMMPELIGPNAEPFDLRFIGQDGRAHDTAVLVLVSNNPYVIDPRPQTRHEGGPRRRGARGHRRHRAAARRFVGVDDRRRFASTRRRPSRSGSTVRAWRWSRRSCSSRFRWRLRRSPHGRCPPCAGDVSEPWTPWC